MPEPLITSADKQQFRSIVEAPDFRGLPADQKKKALRAVAVFQSAPESALDGIVSALDKKLPPAPSTTTPAPPVPRPAKGGFLERAGEDLSIGFRSGLSDLEQTAANITRSKSLGERAKKTAPRPQETAGHESMTDMLLQGAGSLPANIVKYGPAMLAGKYAPIVAGATGAASALNQGPIEAIKAGARDAAGFYLQEKAATLPTRLGRAAASAVALGVPAAIETGGNVAQTGAAAVLGAGMGAISPKPGPGKTSALAKGTSAAASLKDDLLKSLAPAARSPEAAKTGRIARPHLADFAQRADRAEYALRKARNFFDDLPAAPQAPGGLHPEAFDFIDKIESGNIQAINPELRPYAQAIRDAFDQRLKELQSHGLLTQFVDNYFPHLWKHPQRATQVFQILGRRPLEGPKTFLRQRKFASIAEGLKFAQQNPGFGLELATKNPVDMSLLKLREMDRLLTARNILGEMKGTGLLQFVNSGKKPPSGYTKIDDKVSTVMFKHPKSGMWTIAGSYYAPEPAARLINNYLSPGLRSKEWFRAANLMANSLNQFQLGWSAFHLGFTTFDAMMSNFALGTEKIIHGLTSKQGRFVGEGLKEYAKAPLVALEPLAAPFIGKQRSFTNQIWDEWMNPGSHPNVAPIVEVMKQAGARVQLDPFYKTSIWRNMRRAMRDGQYVSAAMKLPAALTEQAMKPIMEVLVPRQKIGAFARLAQFEIDRLPRGFSQDQLRGAVQKAWDSVDNRMGQLVYDNLFWDRTAKDLMMASVRSVGWNLGTFREIGGGIYDLATIHKRIASGDRAFTHRMAYITSLPVVVGMIGGLTNYLNTGQAPQGIDYFFPRTGKLDEYGRPERISFPTYMKDVYHYAHDFPAGALRTLKGKVHPMFGAIADMIDNQDWQGEKIRNEDDPLVKQLVDLAKFAGEQAEPFAARYAVQDVENELKGLPPRYTTGERIGAFFGITPAPADIKKSEAEQYLDKHAAEQYPAGGRTHAAAQRFDVIRDIERGQRLGVDTSKFAQQQVDKGVISENDIQTGQARAETSPLVRKLNRAEFNVALKAYEYALEDLDRVSVKELAEAREIIQRKVDTNIDKIYALPAGDRSRLRKLERIRRLGLELPAPPTPAPPNASAQAQ